MSVITVVSPNTKVTTLDGVDVLWDKGDNIKLFTKTWNEGTSKYDASWCDYNSSLQSPSPTATFMRDEANTNTVDNTSGRYFAVYRKGANSYLHQSRDYYAQLALDKAVVVKNGGDFASSIMYATSENTEFQFAHAVSYIKFTVNDSSTPFMKLIVSPVNASENITSRIKITFSSEESLVEVLNGNTQDSNSITLTTDDNKNFANGTYYFAVNPGTYTEGFKFTFENETGENAVVTKSANVVMEAGTVSNLGTIGTLAFPAPKPEFEPSLYVENGENKGVIFWIDPSDPTKGKAVSGLSTEINWHSSQKTFDDAAKFAGDDSKANFEYLINREDYKANADKYAAIYFCESLGAGWRLPSMPEIEELFRTWSGVKGNLSTAASAEIPYTLNNETAELFDNLLLQCKDNTSGLLIKGSGVANWYWTCQSDVSTKKIYRVKIATGYFIGAANATNAMLVRCVRDVEVK